MQAGGESLQRGVVVGDTPNDFTFGRKQSAAGQQEQDRVVHAIQAIDHARPAEGAIVLPDKAESSAEAAERTRRRILEAGKFLFSRKGRSDEIRDLMIVLKLPGLEGKEISF